MFANEEAIGRFYKTDLIIKAVCLTRTQAPLVCCKELHFWINVDQTKAKINVVFHLSYLARIEWNKNIKIFEMYLIGKRQKVRHCLPVISTPSLCCVPRLPWRHPVLFPLPPRFEQEVVAGLLPGNHRQGCTALSEGCDSHTHKTYEYTAICTCVWLNIYKNLLWFSVCVCVAEGTGPLLRLRVLPSGARQIPEERILPEGQCHPVAHPQHNNNYVE